MFVGSISDLLFRRVLRDLLSNYCHCEGGFDLLFVGSISDLLFVVFYVTYWATSISKAARFLFAGSISDLLFVVFYVTY